ncbi:MBOAT family O-acyltransferase [Cerasicoccus arenae]|uniref:O-acyltransferase n=1 Tax=Cerasicoccus arenae TaxID=424488 RepID=A0A8J3DGY3_9BACT|nr:MBOAT family protein [Cerasicoccus arenae]MBK1857307.1 MBOAT family protein [Cerasicoccus arenae]GHC00592.1 O-acyltransferase [Cerasicoccus arenae]
MVFTSLTFILFLTLVFSLYWLLRRRSPQNFLILVASYVFYGWWDWRFLSLIVISSVIDFTSGIMIDKSEKQGVRRAWLTVSILANLGMLGFFKYFNFFASSLQTAAGSAGVHLGDMTLDIVLPVGISFYTFQTMSYTIDIYRRQMKSERDPIAFLAFVSFFPQLVAGPIERASQLLPQFMADRKFSYPLAAAGCREILWGFFKKMVIADNMGLVVQSIYPRYDDYSSPWLWLATTAFAFQIYCDFSAYSHIAKGVSRLLGFELMRNFAYPYFSQDIAEFWRRWHISLSTWFRDYVFIPLGGSRGPMRVVIINTIIVFSVSGLWHGAAWNYIIWGFLNGLAFLPMYIWPKKNKKKVRADDIPGGPGLFPKPRVLLNMILMYVGMQVAWVFFASPTLSASLDILKRMFTVFSADNPALHPDSWSALKALLFIGGLVIFEWVQRAHENPLTLDKIYRPLRWAIYTVMLWSCFYFLPRPDSPFIYFQF